MLFHFCIHWLIFVHVLARWNPQPWSIRWSSNQPCCPARAQDFFLGLHTTAWNPSWPHLFVLNLTVDNGLPGRLPNPVPEYSISRASLSRPLPRSHAPPQSLHPSSPFGIVPATLSPHVRSLLCPTLCISPASADTFPPSWRKGKPSLPQRGFWRRTHSCSLLGERVPCQAEGHKRTCIRADISVHYLTVSPHCLGIQNCNHVFKTR